ncbi:hypothetical protein J2W28_004461 [Variovorax boronicumulans]|uniref:hypothetical protein n=1 Tax=Variovorax boronicumulans TaxID=436515 RepID=UPI002782AF64|nr:hypothetical protein [Variovorax boronicumulans]MDP9993837.1 hypothetical protein [Variovorax boronicumulans]MDQ0005299.1 hypothetical protein [Variovorax boronicumulans]
MTSKRLLAKSTDNPGIQSPEENVTIARINQASILVDVDFYDDTEKKRLLGAGYPAKARSALEALAAKPLAIPTSEFLSYFLFHRKGFEGYGSYEEIQRRTVIAENYIDTCLRFDGTSVGLSTSGLSRKDITEHVGESISLSVISRLFGLNEADWAPLPSLGGKGALPSFDFSIASDGKTIVQVESKGSAVRNNARKELSVPNQKKSIHDKKVDLSKPGVQDPYPASVRYGAIIALDARPKSRAKCWLVDPDPESGPYEPNTLKLLKRMAFLQSWIGLLSPRSQLSASLATRLSDLMTLRDPFELDGLPLLRGNGEPIKYASLSPNSPHSTFLAGKSRVVDRPAGGIVVPVRSDLLAFLAVREDLVVIAAEQSFASILGFDYTASTRLTTVECVLPKSRAIDINVPSDAVTSGDHVHFDLEGEVHCSPSGLVFGYLPIPG